MGNEWLKTLPMTMLVLGPIFTATSCFVFANLRFCIFISLFNALLLVVATSILAIAVFANSAPVEMIIGGWQPSLGIRLYVDGFRVIMLLLSAIVGLAITIYSFFYFSESAIALRFWPLWWLMFAGLNGIFLSADIFNTYIMLELLGISAVSLIALNGSQKALNAAYQYLLVSLFGSLMYLFGVALLYRTYGVLDNQLLAAAVTNNASSQLALAFCTIGLLLKCALFPLHFWLPAAHSNAYAPVSAALSALVVKAAFFILFVLWFDIVHSVVTDTATILLGSLGACAVVYGSFKAFTSPRLKLLVAYSTVAQIGYLFLAFPLMRVSPEIAKTAVIYFIVAHGCAKAAMFMSAGNIQKAFGDDRLSELRGIASKLPISIFVFAITSASLIGLPPSGGFIAKWLLLNSAVDADQWFWVLVLFVGGLFASAYLFRVLNLAFTTSENEAVLDSIIVDEKKMLSAAVLALITVIIGLNALWLTNLITSIQ